MTTISTNQLVLGDVVIGGRQYTATLHYQSEGRALDVTKAMQDEKVKAAYRGALQTLLQGHSEMELEQISEADFEGDEKKRWDKFLRKIEKPGSVLRGKQVKTDAMNTVLLGKINNYCAILHYYSPAGAPLKMDVDRIEAAEVYRARVDEMFGQFDRSAKISDKDFIVMEEFVGGRKHRWEGLLEALETPAHAMLPVDESAELPVRATNRPHQGVFIEFIEDRWTEDEIRAMEKSIWEKYEPTKAGKYVNPDSVITKDERAFLRSRGFPLLSQGIKDGSEIPELIRFQGYHALRHYL